MATNARVLLSQKRLGKAALEASPRLDCALYHIYTLTKLRWPAKNSSTHGQLVSHDGAVNVPHERF